MRPPRRLRIGHLTYRVRTDPARCEADGSEGFGNQNLAEIVIRGDRPHQRNAETLLHETLHQCAAVSGAGATEDEAMEVEERLVRAMAGPLLGALRDNPKLVRYLIG